jgi:hypothetical protein
MNAIAYAAACVVLPSLWAIVAFFVFGWLDRRRTAIARKQGDELPPADYMI